MVVKRPNRLKKGRDQRKQRKLCLGGYLIVTDSAETEANYFFGFRSKIPSKFDNDLQLKVYADKELERIIEFAIHERNKDVRFRNIWIIFDRDKVPCFDHLINEISNAHMNVGWSNPCFEIWLSAYFGKMKITCSSVQCCKDFGRLLVKNSNKKEYDKSDDDIYNVLFRCGDEQKAIATAKNRHKMMSKECLRPSDMISCTTVYQLIEEIKEKIIN
jgi:hypothetical protein